MLAHSKFRIPGLYDDYMMTIVTVFACFGSVAAAVAVAFIVIVVALVVVVVIVVVDISLMLVLSLTDAYHCCCHLLPLPHLINKGSDLSSIS